MRSFDVFFDLRLNEQLSKQSLGCWFEMPWHSLWHHCNGMEICLCFLNQYSPARVSIWRPEQNRCHFADSIFKLINFLELKVYVLIQISYILLLRVKLCPAITCMKMLTQFTDAFIARRQWMWFDNSKSCQVTFGLLAPVGLICNASVMTLSRQGRTYSITWSWIWCKITFLCVYGISWTTMWI